MKDLMLRILQNQVNMKGPYSAHIAWSAKYERVPTLHILQGQVNMKGPNIAQSLH